jgi:hypothetical protein
LGGGSARSKSPLRLGSSASRRPTRQRDRAVARAKNSRHQGIAEPTGRGWPQRRRADAARAGERTARPKPPPSRPAVGPARALRRRREWRCGAICAAASATTGTLSIVTRIGSWHAESTRSGPARPTSDSEPGLGLLVRGGPRRAAIRRPGSLPQRRPWATVIRAQRAHRIPPDSAIRVDRGLCYAGKSSFVNLKVVSGTISYGLSKPRHFH